MRRGVIPFVVCAALAALPSGARSAAGPRGPLLTVVLSQRIEPYQQTLAGLRRAFAGASPAAEFHVVDLDGGDDVAPARLAPVGNAPADLVVAIGARAARALGGQALGVPVVVATVADMPPADRPADRPACGVRMEFPYALQFQMLREIAPRVKIVGTIFATGNRAAIDRAEAAAREHGLKLVRAEIVSVKDIPGALDGLIGRVDALWALPDATVFTPETSPYIILQTLRHRIPFMAFSQNFVKAGSLLSLYPDFEDIGLQAGGMARDILSGRRPPGGGVVGPRKALLAINLRVADVIGLRVPPAVRRRASAVYE